MISVFFNEDGYYVTGESIEISRRCSPALTIRGDKIFQSIHHTYKILFLALCELRDIDVTHDVIVYNDSRIIDEVNGVIAPLDDTCQTLLQILRRNTIPSIRSLILFRKKPTNHINEVISKAHNNMIAQIGVTRKLELAAIEQKALEAENNKQKREAVARMKKYWFGDKING